MHADCVVESEERQICDLPLLAIDMILSGLVSDDIKTVSELNQSFYQNARHSTRALAPKLPDSGRLSRISKR